MGSFRQIQIIRIFVGDSRPFPAVPRLQHWTLMVSQSTVQYWGTENISCIISWEYSFNNLIIHNRTYTCMHAYIHTLHYITLHCIALHCIALHYIHYITLHYITLHYITLHYITLHYITLHTYIHICMFIHSFNKCPTSPWISNPKHHRPVRSSLPDLPSR